MKLRQKRIIAVLIVILIVFVVLLKTITRKSVTTNGLIELPFHTPAKMPPSFESSIPRKVFMTWTTNSIPPKMHEVVTNNIKNNPEFDFYLYDETACRKFIGEHFDAETVHAFDALKPKAYKSDLWRYCVLYIYGGVYIDIKFMYSTPLLDIIKFNDTLFTHDLYDDEVCNGYLIAKPKEDVFLQCINKIKDNVKNKNYGKNTLHPTGPLLLGDVVFGNNMQNKIRFTGKLVDAGNYGYKKGVILLKDDPNVIVAEPYNEYREEQRNYNNKGLPHYSELWFNKDIYN